MTPTSTFFLRPLMALVAALGLSACATLDDTTYSGVIDTASRGAPVAGELTTPEAGETAEIDRTEVLAGDYTVTQVNVFVPDTLRVSEANRYLPFSDIVWREDPVGNRHEQVRVIVQNALERGVANMSGEQRVVLDVVMRRFHALTEKARYTTGGVHAIQFTMQLRDVETGEIVAGPKFIKADFGALGGQAAIQAEAQGITQKVRITDHLAYVIEQELTQPRGYPEQANGLIGALNQN